MSDYQPAALDAPLTSQPKRPAAGPSSAVPPVVRPYAMTGGRTRPRYQLAIEALVSTTADAAQLRGQLPEHQRICQLCREIKSVAEISALLTIPLGVVRILVADLAEAGLVMIHQPGGGEGAGGLPDTAVVERVLSGLRKLPATADSEDSGRSSRPQSDAKADPERWLAESYTALVDGLDGVLDVEAGLREALLQPRHSVAVDGLGDVLDVEAGLREALGGQPDSDR